MSDPLSDFTQPDADFDPEASGAVSPDAGSGDAGTKDPDTTGSDASPEAGVDRSELSDDELDREIHHD